MHNLACVQRRHDRRLPAEFPYDGWLHTQTRPAAVDPLQRLRDDIAADPRADADISTAFVERMYDADDRNTVMFLLLAGTPEGDAQALSRLKAALLAVARERVGA
jgi:hypothetical protein